MSDRPRRDPDVLSDKLSTRVLTRASELDAALKAGARISELRAAAMEAGISTAAFDQALAEVQAAESAPMPHTKPAPRFGPRVSTAIATALALLIGVSVLIIPRLVLPARPTTVEQRFELRCLSPAQATELIRPVIDPSSTEIIFSSANPGTMTVRTTSTQMEKVASVLKQNDAACAVTPAKAP